MKNILMVGFGFMGGMHAQVYQQLSAVRLVGIVEPNAKLAEENLKKLSLTVPVFDTLARALQGLPSVDVVDICLPTDMHLAAAVEAFAARKHVFCEKPMALTVEEGECMLKAQSQAGTQLMIGHCIRFWPEYQAFSELVASGKGGKLLSLSLQRRSGRPLASIGNWMNDAQRSAGAAVDLHIHDTDFILSLLGRPLSVSSKATRDSSGLSHIFTDYKYEGVCVTAEGGWNYPAKWGFQMAFQAVFEDGAVEFDSSKTPSLVGTFGTEDRRPIEFRAPSAGTSNAVQGNISSLGGYYNELAYFVNQLEAGKPIEICTGAQALEALDVTLAELRSVNSGQPVDLQATCV